MARFLKASDIPKLDREQPLSAYKRQLRRSLTNKELPKTEKQRLQVLFENLGKPRPYAELATFDKKEVDESSETSETETSLRSKTKRDLLVLAEERKVQVGKSWTKARIVDAILSKSG